MAKFKYVGDPKHNFDGPQTTEQFGYQWVKGEVTEVREETDADKELVLKIGRHSHFVNMADKEKSAELKAQGDALDKREEAEAKAHEKAEAEAEKAAERKHQQDMAAAAAANKTANLRPR